MKIGIHYKDDSFSDRWIKYCTEKKIPWKKVDCYRNDILNQLNDCDALMWHIHQNNPKEILFAKQLIYSLVTSGKKVFPDFKTVWHFDDKLGQKYLLEAIGAPIPDTWIFYSKSEALRWAEQTSFPKVFKLRGGGGSQNVRLVHSGMEAKRLIRKAFKGGFLAYYAIGNIKERWRVYKMGKTGITDLIVGLARLVIPPAFARIRGREKGYVYFQEFIPGNSYDIRIVVIRDKAFAIKRMVRKNDFRASGSGLILYEKDNFDNNTVRLAFELAEKLDGQSVALDFVYSENKIFVLEVSFGFIKEVYDPCSGYWDRNLSWHPGQFNPYGWMIDNLIGSASD